MIEARSLQKRFGDIFAVRGASFTAKDGFVTGILGPNGAGKSTIIRMLGGLVAPDSGDVRVDGLDPRAAAVMVRSRLGILPDARGLYARLSARENVRYFGNLCGLDGEALEARTGELLDMLDLGRLADRRVEGFSQGERMKVAIARAIIHEPQNVMLDEPTNGLDVMSIRSLRRFVRGLASEGKAVLYSSHIMSEVASLCDQVVVLADGRVVATGTPDEVRALTGRESLEDAFVALATGEQGDAGLEAPT